MLTRIKPKHVMMFGVLCMLIGILFVTLWNVVDVPYDIKRFPIIKWARKALGQYGISAIYFFGGLVIFLKGYAAMRSDERSRGL